MCLRNQGNNNVNSNKMVFSANGHVLVKLLRQEKNMVLKNYRKIPKQAVDTVRIKQTVA